MSPTAYCATKGSDCTCDEPFRNKSTTSKPHNSSNEEKSGSGFNFLENLHLVGGAVSQNICKEGDNSWYCGLSRVYSAVFMIIALIVVLFVIVYLFRTFVVPLLGFGKKIRNKSSSSRK